MMWTAASPQRMRNRLPLLLLLLAVSHGSARAQEAKPVKTRDLSAAKWRRWCHPGAHFGGKWGVPEMWWYGKAKAFRCNAEASVRCRHCGEFLLRGRARGPEGKGLFGVELEWGRPMAKGSAYKFVMTFRGPRNLPDFVTVNDGVVWRRADGFAQNSEAHFCYVPARAVEPVVLRLFWECGAEWREVDLFHNWQSRSLTALCAPYTGAPLEC